MNRSRTQPHTPSAQDPHRGILTSFGGASQKKCRFLRRLHATTWKALEDTLYGCWSKNRGFYPQNGWFISWKTLLKWDDLGVPLFLETPQMVYYNLGCPPSQDAGSWQMSRSRKSGSPQIWESYVGWLLRRGTTQIKKSLYNCVISIVTTMSHQNHEK